MALVLQKAPMQHIYTSIDINKVQSIINRAARIKTGNSDCDVLRVELLKQLGLMN